MRPYTQPLTPLERQLRDEVIYLHSLWHQGPPNPYFPEPAIVHNHNSSSRNVHLLNPTPFKKANRNKTRKRKPNNKNRNRNTTTLRSGSDPQPDPGPEWPFNPSPPRSSGWPAFQPEPGPSIRPLSDLDRGKIANVNVQKNVVKCCNEFFRVGFDGDAGDEIDEEEGDGCFDDGHDIEDSNEFKFFLDVFVRNQELRELYEKNHEIGEFYCLVCEGIGEKVGKLFKGCVGLVQHALSISKTKRKRAHRAFCQAICRVLGWDVCRLPMIVLKGEPLSRSLANTGQTNQYCLDEDKGRKINEDFDYGVSNVESNEEGTMECLGEPKENAERGNEDPDSPKNNAESVCFNEGLLAPKQDSVVLQKSDVLMIVNHSSHEDGNQRINDIDKANIRSNNAGAMDSKADLKEGTKYEERADGGA